MLNFPELINKENPGGMIGMLASEWFSSPATRLNLNVYFVQSASDIVRKRKVFYVFICFQCQAFDEMLTTYFWLD